MSEQALEQRIRATLQRRAADIEVSAPPWSELVERAGGVVVPLRPADTIAPPAHLRRAQRPRLPRVSLRPALATAAALLVAFGAAVVVGGHGGAPGGQSPGDGDGGESGGDSVLLDAPASPVIPAPGESDFSIAAATPLPLDLAVSSADDDPQSLAQLYLYDVGLGSRVGGDSRIELRIDPYQSEFPEVADVTTGNVWWSVWDRSGTQLADGAVFLRQVDPGAPVPTWEVTGAYTSNIMGLYGVRRADGILAFTVGDYFADPTARVLVNGEELHNARVPEGTKPFVVDDPAPGEVVTIVVQHLEGGLPVSITEMAVAPEVELPVILDTAESPATTPSTAP